MLSFLFGYQIYYLMWSMHHYGGVLTVYLSLWCPSTQSIKAPVNLWECLMLFQAIFHFLGTIGSDLQLIIRLELPVKFVGRITPWLGWTRRKLQINHLIDLTFDEDCISIEIHNMLSYNSDKRATKWNIFSNDKENTNWLFGNIEQFHDTRINLHQWREKMSKRLQQSVSQQINLAWY